MRRFRANRCGRDVEQKLTKQGVVCHRLQTSHAFHSSMMDPMLASFKGRLRQFTFRPPRIPYMSNLTGTWITPVEAADPEYWALHLRKHRPFLGLRRRTDSPA